MHYQLATRFGRNAHQISGREPLDNEALYRHVPSIFAREAHDSRPDRYGTVSSRIDIVRAVGAGEPFTTLPFVRPGGDILLKIEGWPKVSQVLAAIDATEAAGVDPFDVRDNIMAGAAYLRQMHDRYGNATAMLAAYNAGPGRYDDYLSRGRPLPPETVGYLARLTAVAGTAGAAQMAVSAPPDPQRRPAHRGRPAPRWPIQFWPGTHRVCPQPAIRFGSPSDGEGATREPSQSRRPAYGAAVRARRLFEARRRHPRRFADAHVRRGRRQCRRSRFHRAVQG